MKIKITAIVSLVMLFICPMASSTTLVNEMQTERFIKATEESAKQFVTEFYNHLRRGMGRDHLASYYTENMLEEYDEVIREVGSEAKGDLAIVARRLLDLDMMNARCELLENTEVKVYGLNLRKAKLSYQVSPQCASWKNEKQRLVFLTYHTYKERWVISKIEEESE